MGKVMIYRWPGREESRQQPDYSQVNLDLTEVKMLKRYLNRDL